MKGSIERFNELKNRKPTPVVTSVMVNDEQKVTRYNLVDKTREDIEYVIYNFNAPYKSDETGKNDLITVRCPKTGKIHELETFAYYLNNDGCFFLTTKGLREDRHKYMRIKGSASRALFYSRKEVVNVLVSKQFWIDV